MKFSNAKARAAYCIHAEKTLCFISLEELKPEDVKHVFNQEVGLEVPVHKRFIKE